MPGAVWVTTSPIWGLGGVNHLQLHDVVQLSWWYCAEKLYLLLWSFWGVVGSFQLPPTSPNLLHFMYLCIQEVGLPGHFSENWCQDIGSLLGEHSLVQGMKGLPGCLDDFHVLWEGLLAAFFQESSHMPPVFSSWAGLLLRVISKTVASPSPDFGVAVPWSDQRHCYLVPFGGAGVSTMVGGEFVGAGLLIGVVGWPVVAKRAAKDMFSISNCKGYMSISQTSVAQACKAAPHTSRKDWWSHPSLSMALHPKSCILSSRDCCKAWVWSIQVVSASLMVAAHLACVSQIMAVQRALASLMAVLVWDTSLLWWESMEDLVVSSCPMATFISPCNQSMSSERAPRSSLEWVSDHGV